MKGLAAGCADVTVSPNNALLAYAADTVGGEKYAIWVKELATGRQLLRSPIPVRLLALTVAHWSCGVGNIWYTNA